MMYIWLILGFVLLIKGADYFVEASSSIARTLRVPRIIIGLTIVAFGTSAPELAVSTTATLSGNNDIAIGNVTWIWYKSKKQLNRTESAFMIILYVLYMIYIIMR